MRRQRKLTPAQRRVLLGAQLMPAEYIFCARTMRTREITLEMLEAAGYARCVESTGATWYQLTPAGRAVLEIATLAAICPTCGGSGEVDSGGFTPWGVGIDVTCPTCQGSGKAYSDTDATPLMWETANDDTPPHEAGKESR